MAAFVAFLLLLPNYQNGLIQLSLDNTTAVAYLNHQGAQISALAIEMWCWYPGAGAWKNISCQHFVHKS